uniref:Uncharacterized protein n=1 Tax=Arundo donax TaxID=35708 RepID=A0A0A9FSX1_ARUDO
MLPRRAVDVLVQRHAHAIRPAQRQGQRRLARLVMLLLPGAEEAHGGGVRGAVRSRVDEHSLAVTVAVSSAGHGDQASHAEKLHVGMQAEHLRRPVLHHRHERGHRRRRGVRRREVVREAQARIMRHLRQV